MPHLASRYVILTNANIAGMVAFAQSQLGQIVGGMIVVMVYAAKAVKMLSKQHNRCRDRVQLFDVIGCDDGGHEDDAVNAWALGEDLENADLLFRAVVGVGE